MKWLQGFAVASLLGFSVSGCALTAGTQAVSAAQELEGLVPLLILAKYQNLHNLKVGMEQIDSQPGMVIMMQPPPVVTPTTPVLMPAPAPPAPVPALPSTLPTMPTNNG
jgi:hypothetical protein